MQFVTYQGRGVFGYKRARVSRLGLQVGLMMLPGHATVDEWRETGKSLVLAVSSTRGGNPASLGKAEREEDRSERTR